MCNANDYGAGVLFKEICKLFPRITLQILII